jgi:hypothetical protein
VDLASPFAPGERRLSIHAGEATLSMPEAPKALVLSIGGDGRLAAPLAELGFATVLAELPSDGDVVALLDALAAEPATAGLAIAIVAGRASVAAAEHAAAARPRLVFALVCRDGRPAAAAGPVPLLAGDDPEVIAAFLDLRLPTPE